MIQNTNAIISNGVLKPVEKLDIPDGTEVERTVRNPIFKPKSPEEIAKAIEELHRIDAVMDAEPDDGYDVIFELNAHRARIGARLLTPPSGQKP